jgi:site-specific DNA-cytosine methylase
MSSIIVNVIDLFSGIGGLSAGIEIAMGKQEFTNYVQKSVDSVYAPHFNLLAAIDLNETANKVYRQILVSKGEPSDVVKSMNICSLTPEF